MVARGRSGQLDEISESIGEIRAYVHEGRHGVNNLSMKMDAMAVEQAKRHETLKLELGSQMEKMAESLRAEIASAVARITRLEEARHRFEGERSVWKWLAEHWPLGLVFSALAALIAWANGKIGV